MTTDLIQRLRTRPTGDPYLHMMVHEAADELERLRAQVAPAKPTPEMLKAGRDAVVIAVAGDICKLAEAEVALIWAAMLAASPAAPAQQADDMHSCGDQCQRPACVEARQSLTVGGEPVAGVQVQGSTIYVLNANGANRWWATVQPGQDDDGKRVSDAECEAIARQLAAHPAAQAEPLFWYRPCGDGLYEGPHHHNSVGGKMLRDEKPGAWVPLYPGAAPAHHPAQGLEATRELLDALDAADEGCTDGGLGPGWQNGHGIECGARIAAARQAARAALAQAQKEQP